MCLYQLHAPSPLGLLQLLDKPWYLFELTSSSISVHVHVYHFFFSFQACTYYFHSSHTYPLIHPVVWMKVRSSTMTLLNLQYPLHRWSHLRRLVRPLHHSLLRLKFHLHCHQVCHHRYCCLREKFLLQRQKMRLVQISVG